MKIRIKKTPLPKAQYGIECPEGFVRDENGICVPEGPQKFNVNPLLSSQPFKEDQPVNSPLNMRAYYDPNTGLIESPFGVVTQEDTQMIGFTDDRAKNFLQQPAKKVGFFDKPAVKAAFNLNDAFSTLTTVALPIAKYFDNKQKIRDAKQKQIEARFNTLNPAPKFRGNFNDQGLFRPQLRGVNEGMFGNNFNAPIMGEYGGELSTNNAMKIRITQAPKMEYGGQSNYGLDIGRRKVYTDMPDTTSEGSKSSMSQLSNPDEPYILEAEGGETIWRPDGTHFNITGDRHHSGGEKLTAEQAPEGSFIFSDTKKMAIKDPQILAHFGVSYKKGGVTPAAIAKRFPLNDFMARLQDKTRESDSIGMKSDELSVKKNMRYLAELAAVQEGMKGEPMPMMSKAVLEQAQMQQAAFGGYVMPQFQGSKGSSQVDRTKIMKRTYQPEFRKTVLDPKNPKDYDIIYPAGFDDDMPDLQTEHDDKRVFGKKDWTNPELMADFRKRFPDFFQKNPNWDPTKPGDTKKFQQYYNQNHDPSYFSGAGGYGIDDKFGQHTWSAPAWNKKPKAVDPQYICNDKGEIVPVASGGYKTVEEARQNCPQKKKTGPKYVCVDGKVIESPSGVGYDSAEEAGINCTSNKQKEPPFEWLAPDKMNLGWKAQNLIPNIYMPTMYQLPRRQAPLALDDWFAAAQNRQAGYNTAMDTAARTNQSQAVGSFLAGLVGAQDATDIARVNSANLDRAERRQMADMEADFRTDVFNLGQRQEYDKGIAVAQQQYDNARLQRGDAFVQAFADGWQNAGDLYDINMRDPYFYRDPRSNKTIFKGAAGNVFSGGASPGYGTNGAGGLESLGATANSLYKKYYDSLSDIKDEKERSSMAKSLVTNAINSSRQTSTQSYDANGMPRSSNKRSLRFNYSGNSE